MPVSPENSDATFVRRPFDVHDFWNMRRITDVQTSTRNETAYVVQATDETKNVRLCALWLLSAAQSGPVCLTGSTFDAEPRWSADGRSLALSSGATSADIRQLWLIDARTHARRQLTCGSAAAYAPAWSPDGRALCFVADVRSDELRVAPESDWYASHPDAARSSPLRRLTSRRSRVDGSGYRDRRAQLFTLAVSEREPAPLALTASAYDDVEPAWSPDGHCIAFVSNRSNDTRVFSERNIWTIDVASGELRQLTTGFWLDGPLAWSPDGRSIACVGARGLHVPFSLRLWIVARDGSGAVCASEGFGAHLWPSGAPLWTADAQRVFVAAAFGATGQLIAYDRDSRVTGVALRADAVFGSCQLLADGNTFVAAASSPEVPSALVTGSLAGGTLTTLLDVNASWLCEVEPAATRNVHFTSADGLEIRGWLVTPPHQDPPYPCILDVHYGPNAAWGPAFAFNAQTLAGRGFASLLLNPRGSSRYGDDFAAAADFGAHDYEDLLSGLDTLITQGVIDPHRLGIMGLSYGGFMASWAITQTQRFRAAVSINGISDQLSWYLLSDTGLFFFRDHFGDPFADAAGVETYWRHSPLAYVHAVETPLLLLQSEDDYRCPIDQGEQLFGALVARGQTVELIRFPNASHDLIGTAAPLHAYLAHQLTIEWFERFIR